MNNKSKCKFCNNEKPIISFEGTYEDGYTAIDRYKNGSLYIDGDSLNMECDFEVGWINETQKIQYCPMCGRNLMEEDNAR